MSTLQYTFFNGVGSNSLNQSLPVQTISKFKKDKNWIKSCLNKLEQIGIKQLHSNMEFNDYYNMCSGDLVYADYGLPDLTRDIVELRRESGMAVSHRHYDFLGIMMNQIKGEYSKIKDTWRVDTIDAVSQSDFLRDRKAALEEYTIKTFDNYIQRKLIEKNFEFKQKFQSEEEKQQYLQQLEEEKAKIVPPEVIEEQMSKDWKTVASKWASNVLEYDHLRSDFNLDEIENEEIVDYILTGRFFRHYHVGYDFYKPERWDPRTTFFSQDVEARYPQNGEYIGRIHYLSGSDIINRYGHKLTEEEQKRLSGYFNMNEYEGLGYQGNGSRINSGSLHEIHHVPFKGYYDYDLTLQMQDAFQTPFGETTIFEDGVQKKVPAWFSPINKGGGFRAPNYAQDLRNDIDVRTDLYQVTEGYWRSQKKIGYLTYTTEEGKLDTAIVTEDILKDFLKENNIKTLKTVSLESAEINPQPNTIVYTYVPEIRWGVKISANNTFLLEDIFLGGEPTEFQIKGGPGNVYDVVFPVVGYIGESRAKKLRPYIIKHNIVLNQVYNLLEKELGTFLIFDMHFLPSEYKKNVSTKESLEMLYEAVREIGIAPIDTSKQNLSGTNQQMNTFMTQSLDFTNQIASRMQLAQQFKMMALEQFGFTPQRMGQSSDYVTATGVREGMTATYNQTEDIFSTMSIATRKATEVHLAIAQYCQKNFKDFSFFYVKSDGDKSFIELSDKDFPLRLFSVFPVNSSKSKRELETLKQTLFQMNTQGSDILDFAEITASTSVQNLIQIGRRNRLEAEKMEKAKREHEQALMDKQLQAQAQEKQADREWEENSKQKDRENKVLLEYIEATGRAADAKANEMSFGEIQKAAQAAFNNDIKSSELDVKQKSLGIKEKETQARIDAMAQEIKLKLEDQKIKRDSNATQRFVAAINPG